MTLTDFLLVRIAEDEASVAHPPHNDQYPHDDMRIGWTEVGAISEVLTIGEARLRAECEAKRRIVEQAAFWESEPAGRTLDYVARLLALPYVDHPDYREEWKP
jgi:hypothetical protein